MAESLVHSDKADVDDSSSGQVRAETKQNRLTSSLDELAAEREQQSEDLMRANANHSDSLVNPTASPNETRSASTSTTARNSNSVQGRSQTDALFEDIDETPFSTPGDRVRDASSESLAGARGRRMHEMASQKVKRTLSEPKASKLNVNRKDTSDPDSDRFLPKRADTIAPVQRAHDPKLRELNIDERAFLAAAKRMGANKSFEMKINGTFDSNQESDPKARLFQQRLKMGEASTAKVVVERNLLQEKKLFKLSSQEQNYLTSVLKVFRAENNSYSLSDLSGWAEARIGKLENKNIADVVSVEEQSMSSWHREVKSTKAAEKEENLEETNGDQWSYDSLVSAMKHAQPWLGKCKLILAPYASLVKDIHDGVTLLEVQRSNTSRLSHLLTELIETLSFKESEQSLVDGIGTCDASLNLAEFDGEDFQAATRVIATKVAALRRLSPLADMEAVGKVQGLLSQRQQEASTILMPMLKEHIDQIYDRERNLIAQGSFEMVRKCRFRDSMSTERQEFLKGVQSLAIFGKGKFVELLEHFISLSSALTMRILHAGMERMQGSLIDGGAIVRETKILSKHLFYAAVVEGVQACQLFADVLGAAPEEEIISLPGLLQRLISTDAIIDVFLTEERNDAMRACIYLTVSRYLQLIVREVKDGDWIRNADIVVKTMEASATDGDIDFVNDTAIQRKYSTSLQLTENEKIRRDDQDSQPLSRVSRSASFSGSSRFDRSENAFTCTEYITACMSNYFDIAQNMSNRCNSLAAGQVSSYITALSNSMDMNSDHARAEFLFHVQESMDLCDILTASEYDLFKGPPVKTAEIDPARSFCERLVAAAMRSTEISTHSCIERVSGTVKLQCYGYIAATLDRAEIPEYLIPFAHLSARVWRHVMAKWAEREVFGSLFSSLKMESTKPSGEAQRKFQSVISELDVSQMVLQMKNSLLAVLETASKGFVLEASCAAFISLTKEKLEDCLYRAKKQRLSAESRSLLATVSKELLVSLRTELGRLSENRKRKE